MLTVTAAAENYNLVSHVAYARALGIPASSNVDQPSVKDAIAQASGLIAAYCNRVFAEEGLSESFRLRWRAESLQLSRFPASAIASVVENGTTLAPSDYELTATNGTLIRLNDDREWCWPSGKIVVAYTAGYALPEDVPPALVRAAIDLTKWLLAHPDAMLRSTDIPGVISNAYRDFPDDCMFPPEIEAQLSQFRKPAGC